GTPTGGTPTGTPGGTPTGMPTGGAPTGTPTGGAPDGPPAPMTQAELEQLYIAGCKQAAGGAPAGRYCQCMYDHIARAQAFSSRARLLALARRIELFNHTHNPADLPKWLLKAQATCVNRLPSPPLALGQLPSLHHPAAPAHGGRQASDPAPSAPTASSPTSPAPGTPAAQGGAAPAARRPLSPAAGIARLARRLRDRLLMPRRPRTR
ncbi:MAG: hypothetical protein ACRDMJ_06810, partial [Solirubrobacteraceae bacterium]